jgi:hypothetical protein
MWWFTKKKSIEEEPVDIWKSDFSECVTADYIPDYSACQTKNNTSCRFVARYAGMSLCSNPNHKSFIPEGSEPFNPHKGQFST